MWPQSAPFCSISFIIFCKTLHNLLGSFGSSKVQALPSVDAALRARPVPSPPRSRVRSRPVSYPRNRPHFSTRKSMEQRACPTPRRLTRLIRRHATELASMLANDHVADAVEALNGLSPALAAQVLEQMPFGSASEILGQPAWEHQARADRPAPARACRLLSWHNVRRPARGYFSKCVSPLACAAGRRLGANSFRPESQRNFNNIRVRSFIPSGAPKKI